MVRSSVLDHIYVHHIEIPVQITRTVHLQFAHATTINKNIIIE